MTPDFGTDSTGDEQPHPSEVEDPKEGVIRHRETTPDQPGDKPFLAQLFADRMAELNLTTERHRHDGAMPDLTIPPSEISPQLEAEMRGMMITIPAMNRWGVFSSVRHNDEDAFTVVLDDDPIDLNDATRLHVSAGAWREVGQGDVVQYYDAQRGQEIPGHLGEHPRPDVDRAHPDDDGAQPARGAPGTR